MLMCAKPLAVSEGPFVQAETLPLFHREVRERLSPTALQVLIERAEIFVEGATSKGSSARGTFLGSALLTLDLAGAERLRMPRDAATAARLGALLADDTAARALIIARALEVVRARLAAPAGLRAGELSVRTDGTRVLVDLELEAPAQK
jgi:hypothetical protein